MLDILVSGVGKLPEHWEETVFAGKFFPSIGGGAANSAITLGRLGAVVEIAGKTGDDSFGELINAELCNNGVLTGNLLCQEKTPSGLAIGLVNPEGKRCFITSRGANDTLHPGEFNFSAKKQFGVFFVNGFFQFPQAEGALLKLSKEFRQARVKIAFDMASWDASGRWMGAVAPFVPHISCFFCNTTQLKILTGQEDQKRGAKFLLEQGAGEVIVKMGPLGCTVYGSDQPIHTGAPDLPVVDTTGAGDSFDAAYLFALSKGWTPFECSAFGNTVAGINCGSFGATGGVPDYKTALREMARYYTLPREVS
jgi:sugar/nucleoside kinase (ribokinase family)